MRTRTAVLGAAGLAVAGAVGSRIALERATRTSPELGPVPDFVRPDGDEITVRTDDGAELAVISIGEGPAVVLTHGWTADVRMWVAMVDRLRTAGFRVVLWDHRGHGRSTVGTDGFGVARLGKDLAAVLEELDLDHAIVLGHSMGGIAVQSLAAHCPRVVADRVVGMVLVSTLARPALPARFGASLVAALRAPLFERLRGRSGLLARYVARRSMGEPVTESMIAWSISLFEGCPTSTVFGAIEPLIDFDLRSHLGSLTTPTIVVTGDRDRVVPDRLGVEIDGLLPRSQLRWLPECGHQVPFERPNELFGVIVGLAEDLDERFGVPGLRRSD